MRRETFERLAKSCRSEAALFHVLAAPVFSRLGLRLINNPHERFGRYGYSSAQYELRNGLSLSVGIEPADGRYLELRFGRRWFVDGKLVTLSNSYYVFARLVGVDLPESYDLGFEEQLVKSLRVPIADVERSWAAVCDGVSDSVIENAERSRYGAMEQLQYFREINPRGVVTVEGLRAPPRS